MDVISTIHWIVRSDEKRKVEFVKRSDGTFGFQEWIFFEEEKAWGTTRIRSGSRCISLEDAIREAKGRVDWLASELAAKIWYQLGWTTLPGLRGLSCSEFRATPTTVPDNQGGVAIEFETELLRDDFLKELEAHFGPKRFTNAADTFDTVKAYVFDRVARK